MEKLNKNTRKAQYYINAYNRSKMRTIFDCYKKPSQVKISASTLCEKLAERTGVPGTFKIIRGSISEFTCGWHIRYEDGSTMLRVETHLKSYIIEL